jgi:protein SCO1/2
MFAIIFMWTPPHFWALALCVKDEYAKASVPMLPVVKGETHTRRQIFGYTVALVPLTLALFFTRDCGRLYLAAATLLGAGFLTRAWAVLKAPGESAAQPDPKTGSRPAWRLFGYSIVYLLALYVVMMVDALAWGAEKIPYELRNVGITETFGAQVDLGYTFRDETGKKVTLGSVVNGSKPVLLFLAYYECPNLCNLFLNGATETLKRMAMEPGRDFEIVTVSIDPRENPELAAAKKGSLINLLGKPDAARGWHFWVDDHEQKADAPNANSKKLAEQVGFHYRYDKDQDQYAHTSGMVVLTPEGKVSRYLYGIEFRPNDVRLALAEAGGDRIGRLADKLLLFCYHYDPKGKRYAIYATNLMRAGGGFTVFLVGGVLTGFWRRNRRRSTGKSSKRG